MEDDAQKISDIRMPEKKDVVRSEKLRAADFSPKREAYPPRKRNPRRLPRGILWGVAGLVAIFVGAAAFDFYQASKSAPEVLSYNLGQLQSGVDDLKNLDAQSAAEKFSSVGGGASSLEEALGGFQKIFGGAADMFADLRELSVLGVFLAEELGFLEKNAPALFLSGGGEEIIGRLKNARDILEDIKARSEKFSAAAESFREISPLAGDFYLPLRLDIERLGGALDAAIGWLDSPSPRRIFVMFQNPSEMRPAGGFLGSYAVLTINGASFAGIEVRDVNDADNLLEEKIVPPRPLQAIASDWGIAGANWFFDFPQSAEKVIELAELSKLYSEEGIKFDGAIAVSPKVVEDILEITGPLEIGGGELILDSGNFLIGLQKEVADSRNERATYPKEILREAVGLLLGRMKDPSSGERGLLAAAARDWTGKKDAMIYFKDAKLAGWADFYGLTGAVFNPHANFNGTYLAVVDANIDGGKTDIFVSRKVRLESQINADGTVSNHLVVSRRHGGDKAKYPWYRVANQNYLRVFAPRGSRLTQFSGGEKKVIRPKVNYASRGYREDPVVAGIEAEHEDAVGYPAVEIYTESGKQVFATWSRLAAGREVEIVLDYSHRLATAPADGIKYQFVFEKQAGFPTAALAATGAERTYEFSVSAPVGFRFRENGLPVFTHTSSDPPGRLILDLTLERI